MKESDKLIALSAALIAPFHPAFNVTGTCTGRIRRNQCAKCQTKLPPGRKGRLCKKCRNE